MATDAYGVPDTDFVFERPKARPKFFSTHGRLGALKFVALSTLWTVIPFIAIMGIAMSIQSSIGYAGENIFSNLTFLSKIPLFIVGVFLASKRLHDLGMSAWFLLVVPIPIVGWIFMLYMMLKPGDESENKYGAVPETKAWEKVLGSVAIVCLFLFTLMKLIN